MEKYIIDGPNQLSGAISVSGAKNMATKALAACLLSDQSLQVDHVPNIEDVKRLMEILQALGVGIDDLGEGKYKLSPGNIDPSGFDGKLVERLRASIVMIGPLLARFGEVKFPHPGGCVIGKRPIDLFIKGFRSLGAEISETDGYYEFKAKKLQGSTIIFPQISVTGTETLLLASILAKGKTTLVNAAQEPEITALVDYLNSQGARITGAGTSTLTIEGVASIGAGEIKVIPDRIEAGSFLAMALASGSEIDITDCRPEHLAVALETVKNMGAKLEVGNDFIRVKKAKILTSVKIKTHEYPGFATDIQAPFTVLATQANGLSLIHETIYEGRLFYTDYLNRMGASVILCDPHRVIITGPTALRGKKLESPDLRAGIAMVIAGLIASGRTEIDNIYQIERGYENLIEKLKNLGAQISRR